MEVDRSCVGHWEGVHNAHPGHVRLAELARVLVVSYEWLATGRGAMRLGHDPIDDIPAAYGKLVDDPNKLRMLHAWDLMPSRSRCALLELAEQLARTRKPKLAKQTDTVQLAVGTFDGESGVRVKF